MRRLDVFVSGYAPGRAERAHYPAAQDLRAAGFAVTLGRPGVHLLYPSSDPRFCEPDAAVWMLERAVHLLHESARPGPQS